MRNLLRGLLGLGLAAVVLAGCGSGSASVSSSRPAPAPRTGTPVSAPVAAPTPRPVSVPATARPPHPVMLGIDVLAADGFAAVKGKRIGLLTHPAGVNRQGRSTIDILHDAAGVDLVCLFAPEHALSGQVRASENVEDEVHAATGLPVYSLHGKNRKPTPAQLKGLNAVVVDLQDIGVRSYTFNVAMRYTMDACFANGVEVIVLDRPNPLGGLKVDGPTLDREWMSGVGAFRVPYVHGLTIGELARMAARAPGVLDVPEEIRAKGKLTVIPMRGWRRTMRWPETGLRFVPTSPLVQDFPAVIGYAMTGLGCEYSGFKHGAGKAHPFRALSFKGKTPAQLKADLERLKIPGLAFRLLPLTDAQGKPTTALYVDIADWDAWHPTELSFELMRLACVYDPPNPYAKLGAKESRSFNIHAGSTAWWEALTRDGTRVDLKGFRQDWEKRALVYQRESRKYWIYGP